MYLNCNKCGRGSEIVSPRDCFFCNGLKPSVEPHEKRYCSECGVLCRELLVPAELNEQWIYDSGGGSGYPLDTPYDKKTGQRNYCYQYICPNHKKKKWFQIYSPHDKYFVDKVIKI